MPILPAAQRFLAISLAIALLSPSRPCAAFGLEPSAFIAPSCFNSSALQQLPSCFPNPMVGSRRSFCVIALGAGVALRLAAQQTPDPEEADVIAALDLMQQAVRDGKLRIPNKKKFLDLLDLIRRKSYGYGIEFLQDPQLRGIYLSDAPERKIRVDRTLVKFASPEELAPLFMYYAYLLSDVPRRREQERIAIVSQWQQLLAQGHKEAVPQLMHALAMDIQNDVDAKRHELEMMRHLAGKERSLMEYLSQLTSTPSPRTQDYNEIKKFMTMTAEGEESFDEAAFRWARFSAKHQGVMPILANYAKGIHPTLSTMEEFRTWILSWLEDPQFYNARLRVPRTWFYLSVGGLMTSFGGYIGLHWQEYQQNVASQMTIHTALEREMKKRVIEEKRKPDFDKAIQVMKNMFEEGPDYLMQIATGYQIELNERQMKAIVSQVNSDLSKLLNQQKDSLNTRFRPFLFVFLKYLGWSSAIAFILLWLINRGTFDALPIFGFLIPFAALTLTHRPQRAA